MVLKQRAADQIPRRPLPPTFSPLHPPQAPPFLHLCKSLTPEYPPDPSNLFQSETQMPSDQFDDSDNEEQRRRYQQSPMMSKPSPRILSLILRAIIMSLLTSIFFLLVGIAAIFLTHLFLAGRHLHRHQRRRQSSNFQQSDTGMSNEDLHQLPGFRFDGGSSEELDVGSECVICLDRIRDGDLFRILPGCNHAFHLDCIDTWLLKAPACPICRARVCAGAEIGADDECKQLWSVRA